MRPGGGKAKGKAFEKLVSGRVQEWLGLGPEDIIRTRSGDDDCDIGLSPAAKKIFPYWLECKHTNTLSIPAWLRQAEAAIKRHNAYDQTPVIVFRQTGSRKLYAVVEFEHFMDLATRFLIHQEK